MKAFKLRVSDIDLAEILSKELIHHRIYKHVHDAIYSDRSYKEIKEIAQRIGMYIPPEFRKSIKSYNYFIQNVYYYNEINEKIQNFNVYKLSASYNTRSYLMLFDDFKLLSIYTDVYFYNRKQFIDDVLEKHKNFKLTWTKDFENQKVFKLGDKYFNKHELNKCDEKLVRFLIEKVQI